MQKLESIIELFILIGILGLIGLALSLFLFGVLGILGVGTTTAKYIAVTSVCVFAVVGGLFKKKGRNGVAL